MDRGADGTSARLTRSAAAWKDMAAIYINECSDTVDGQKWNVMADGRIAVVSSTPRTLLPCPNKPFPVSPLRRGPANHLTRAMRRSPIQ